MRILFLHCWLFRWRLHWCLDCAVSGAVMGWGDGRWGREGGWGEVEVGEGSPAPTAVVLPRHVCLVVDHWSPMNQGPSLPVSLLPLPTGWVRGGGRITLVGRGWGGCDWLARPILGYAIYVALNSSQSLCFYGLSSIFDLLHLVGDLLQRSIGPSFVYKIVLN